MRLTWWVHLEQRGQKNRQKEGILIQTSGVSVIPPTSTWTEADDDFCFSDLQGSLTLKLPVGKAVVQSLSFHPTETCLVTAMEGRVQVWGAEPEETEEDGAPT